ncbi:DUF1990 family protein [Microvirga sp. STS02]|uniref:DUF1990 family protein n=1 Tax=Hymenobacter negativus TaxID=2795026 RepID=UPI0018DE047F|nr:MULTISPECIES: DUF1990 family protein [Bacteria]MBH8568152.1 DUF1990 family protein [Hymenobacter negativus]MBR7207887.1 DUF1990 family protein [Microvirga sp. STS02]
MSDSTSEQPASTGSGPLLERRYFIDVQRARKSPAQLMAEVQADVPRFSPDALANFKKKEGDDSALKVGDEFSITILGPWDGCVRVTEVSATSFEFITLEGHPEAGRIRFETHYLDESPDVLRFEICSSARSRDGLVAFAYDTLGGGKLLQEATWTEFCRRVAAASGGEALHDVVVETFRHDEAGHVQHTRHE